MIGNSYSSQASFQSMRYKEPNLLGNCQDAESALGRGRENEVGSRLDFRGGEMDNPQATGRLPKPNLLQPHC